MEFQKHEKPERNAEIIRLREAGETYASLAVRFGITTARVRQIYLTYPKRLARGQRRAATVAAVNKAMWGR